MQNEIWKPVKGFEGYYEISNMGRLKSLGNGNSNRSKLRILKIRISGGGYVQYVLFKNGKRHSKKAHRLVCEHFLDNPNDYPSINHKDENKLNNSVDNLEWCSHMYNHKYGTRSERASLSLTNHINLSKPVKQLDVNGNLIKTWESLMEAQRNGFLASKICLCCKGINSTHKNFIWKYV